MSITSEITKLNSNLTDSYTACNTKGATMPSALNFDNLPNCIDSIPTGSTPVLDSLTITPTTSSQSITPPSGVDGYNSISVNAVTSSIDSDIQAGNIKSGVNILGVQGTYTGTTPTGTISITQNGTYDVTNYASASVNVSGGSSIGIPREVSAGGVYQMPSTSFTFSLPSGATSIGAYAMAYAFYDCTNLTSVDLSSLTTIGSNQVMYYAFTKCTNLTSIDLSNLTTLNGSYAMRNAFSSTGLTGSVDLSSLTTISGEGTMQYVFYNCTNLTNVDLSSLTTISGQSAFSYAFNNCTGLTSVDLSSLTTVSGASAMYYAFNNCTSLTGALDLSSLTTLSGGTSTTNGAMAYAFYGTKITSVDLSGLTSLSNAGILAYAFYNCKSLTSANLGNITTITGTSAMADIFHNCTSLASVDFSKLTTIGTNNSSTNNAHFANAFRDCNALTSITFTKLEKIYCTGASSASYGTFYNNNKVEKFYFPKLDTITYGTGASSTNQNACKNIFSNCSALTEIHFGAANQSAIQASPGYSTLWGRGAGNATVYFDL